MLRYIIGISILTIGIIFVRALSNGKILRRYQYAFWIVIPLYMILMPFIKIDVPAAEIWNALVTPKTETAINEVADNDSPAVEIEDIHTEQIVSDNLTIEEPETQNSPELIVEHELITNNHMASNIKPDRSKKIESVLVRSSYCVSVVLTVALIAYNTGFILLCKRNRKLC